MDEWEEWSQIGWKRLRIEGRKEMDGVSDHVRVHLLFVYCYVRFLAFLHFPFFTHMHGSGCDRVLMSVVIIFFYPSL
jgi:hypothetical protein